jgi:hypothetical protein
MRVSIAVLTLSVVFCGGVLTNRCEAQNQADIRVATATPAATPAPKFKFILFYKENNPATQAMADALKRGVEQRSQRAEWVAVNVTDPAQQPVVDRFRVARAPMPMVLCLAPNGAITGGITKQLTDQAIEDALVTPGMAEAARVLQDKKILIVHVKRDPQLPIPAGVAQFMAHPDFSARVGAVNVLADDPAEARFVKEMEIKSGDVTDSLVVVLAPPGVFVGKFPANATANQVATALHAAGKCCNDPNCKHNQVGK